MSFGDWIYENAGKVMVMFIIGIVAFFIVVIILYPCDANCKSATDIKTGQSNPPIIIHRPPIGNMPGGVTIIP